MRCSDCNGVIEGRRSFCPHCGRKMGGIWGGAQESGLGGNNPADKQTRLSSSDSSTGGNDPIGRFISKNLSAADAEAARRAVEKLKQSGVPTNVDPRVVKVIIFAVMGGIIGSALPGHLGLIGLFVGLFMGLRNWKK